MLGKFACTNLLAKFYAVNLLNSGVVIYLPCPGIFFSTAVRVVLVDKLVILGTLLLTLFILALRAAVVAKLAILCISLLTFFYLQSFDLNVTCILLKHYIILHHLLYLNQQKQILIYQHLFYLLYFSNCLNYLVHFSINQHLIYLHQIFNLVRSYFLAKSNVSTSAVFFKSTFVA